jgi:hypothetical protein
MSPSCQHGHFLSWISPASASVEARKIERDGAGRASAAGMVSSRCAPWGARRRRTVEGTQAPVRGWGSLRVRPVRRKGGKVRRRFGFLSTREFAVGEKPRRHFLNSSTRRRCSRVFPSVQGPSGMRGSCTVQTCCGQSDAVWVCNSAVGGGAGDLCCLLASVAFGCHKCART